jgi:hypothetical protein
LSNAFILDDKSIKKLHSLIQDMESLNITAFCSDDIKRSFLSIDELLDYENPSSAKILSLRFVSVSKDKRIDIDFGKTYFYSISIDIDAQDTEIVDIKTKLHQVLEGCVPWYSFITRLNFIYLAFFLIIISLGSTLVISAYGLMDIVDVESTPESKSKATLELLFWIFIVFIVSGFLQYFKAKVFPKIYYLLGQQINKYAFLDKVRWIIIASILIPFVLGMF